MSREEILTAIQGLAEKLGRVPTLKELKTMTPVGRRAVRSHFTTYTNALIQCGMESRARSARIPMDTTVCRLGKGGAADSRGYPGGGI